MPTHNPTTGKPTPKPTTGAPTTGAPTNLELNLALGKPTQLSNGADGSVAVDGNTNGDYAAGSVAVGVTWINISLPRNAVINRIKVFNRIDCCMTNLNGFNALVFNEAYAVVGYQTFTGFEPFFGEVTFEPASVGNLLQIQTPVQLMVAEI